MQRILQVRFLFLAAITLAVLGGCAAQWQRPPAQDGQQTPVALVLQRQDTAPRSGVVEMSEAQLRPGDILFSAQDGFNSVGIRLFSLSAVSHAFIYLGDGQAAEAVGQGGTHIIDLERAMAENNLLAVYRRPDVSETDAQALRAFAQQYAGTRYNYLGLVRQAPYTLVRKACELPVVPGELRLGCTGTMALLTMGPGKNERFFCSEFVIAAFNHIGKPLTSVPPHWVNPADILHLREGDVSAVPAVAQLQYVGHLRCTVSPWNPRCAPAPVSTEKNQVIQ